MANTETITKENDGVYIKTTLDNGIIVEQKIADLRPQTTIDAETTTRNAEQATLNAKELSQLRIQKLDLDNKRATFVTNGWSTTEIDNQLTTINNRITALGG